MAGGYTHNPKGAEGVAKRIREIETELWRLRAAITGIGIQIDPEQNALVVPSGRRVLVDGGSVETASFDGDLAAQTAGTSGVAMGGPHDTLIVNNIVLRGQIIGDDALAHPTSVDYNFADVNSTSFTIAGANLAAASITVPSGFTTAMLFCSVNVGDTRSVGAGGAPFYAQAWIGKGSDTTGSAVIATTCADGSSASVGVSWARVLTGLNGGDILKGGAWAAVDATSGWSSGGGNAHSVVTATFYR